MELEIQNMIIARIDQLLSQQNHVMVAIDGCCAAGKTTLAAALGTHYRCNVLHMDDFFCVRSSGHPNAMPKQGAMWTMSVSLRKYCCR